MATLNKYPPCPRATPDMPFTNEWYKFLSRKIQPIADVTTANATDLATAQALANANKAKINALLQSLRDSGILEV